MVKIASIDIGVKNLALCIVENNDIILWEKYSLKGKNIIDICKDAFIKMPIEEISNCNTVLIEQQNKKNIKAIRLEQHFWSWFSTKSLNVIIISAKDKLKFFNQEKTSYYQRKKFAIEKTLEIIPSQWFDFFSTHEKKDDLADSFLQAYAYTFASSK